MRTVFGIVFLIGVGIGVGFYQNDKDVVIKNTQAKFEDVGKQSSNVATSKKIKSKKEEPKDRRCRFEGEKKRRPCTQSEYDGWMNGIAANNIQKKKDKEVAELGKLYSFDDYLNYETKFIQPHTVIDADDVGWGIEDAKYNPKNEILDSYAIKMDTAKLLNNIQNGNVQMVQIDSPRTGETFTYSFKDGAIRNLTSISETSFSVMFSNKYGSKYYLQFLPDSEVSGYFTDRGLRHNIKIKNNTGYIFNY